MKCNTKNSESDNNSFVATLGNLIPKKKGGSFMKKPIVWSSSLLLLFVMFTLAFVISGCEKTEEAITTITPILIGKGNLNGNDSENYSQKIFVIKTSVEWENLKTAINNTEGNDYVTSTFMETEIDFSEYQILAVFDKVHSSGGWTIDITDITERFDSLIIHVSNLATGDLTSAITQPFHIVKIPVSDREIVFEVETDDDQVNLGCNVENPLTDLPWLVEKIDELTLLLQNNLGHVTIYQCVYDNGKIGFLEDHGDLGFFYNCEGEILCIMGGFVGELCPELNIVSKEIIWELNSQPAESLLPTFASENSVWICTDLPPYVNGIPTTKLKLTFYPAIHRVEVEKQYEGITWGYCPFFSPDQYTWDYLMVNSSTMAYKDISETEFLWSEEEPDNAFVLTLLSPNSMKMEYCGILSAGPGSVGLFTFIKQNK